MHGRMSEGNYLDCMYDHAHEYVKKARYGVAIKILIFSILLRSIILHQSCFEESDRPRNIIVRCAASILLCYFGISLDHDNDSSHNAGYYTEK